MRVWSRVVPVALQGLCSRDAADGAVPVTRHDADANPQEITVFSGQGFHHESGNVMGAFGAVVIWRPVGGVE